MTACDYCHIVHACTVMTQNGKNRNPTGPTLLKLAACQYNSPTEYQEAYDKHVQSERIQKWLSIHNDPEYKRPISKRRVRKVPHMQQTLTAKHPEAV